MRNSFARVCALLAASAFAAVAPADAQCPPKTTVADTLYNADGSPAAGRVTISWPTFHAGACTVIAGQVTVTVTNGALSVQLYPNDAATPAGTSYRVSYALRSGRVSTEYWVVPASATPVALATVRSPTVPVPALVVSQAQVTNLTADLARKIELPAPCPAGKFLQSSGAAVPPQVDCVDIAGGGGGGSQHQVNGTNLTANDPVNFQDSATIAFSNPSGGNVQAAVKDNSLGAAKLAVANPGSAQLSGVGDANIAAGALSPNRVSGTAVVQSRAVNTSAPLAGGGDLSADRTLTCAVASATQAGCLSSADWNTFNNKQNALGFTPENVANKGAANGYASLNASSKVVEDPASAQTAPAASKIPLADSNGKIADGWLSSSFPRVLYVYNCTTAGTCNTEANASGTGGARITDDTSTTNEVYFDAQYTVPANFLVTKKVLRVTVGIEFISQASPPNLTFRLYWGGPGGTVLMASTASTPSASATRETTLVFMIQGTAAPGPSVSIETGMASVGGPFAMVTAQPVSAATNSSRTIILSGQWSANATNTHIVRVRQLLVEELN
jgi:hypothetical protein